MQKRFTDPIKVQKAWAFFIHYLDNGCMDMVGNAYEWTANDAKSYPGNPDPFEFKGFHFVRGGCWDDGPNSSVRCSYRQWYLPRGSAGVGPGRRG